MADENAVWALGSMVLGKFWNHDSKEPILFQVIHRTKAYATFQRVDDRTQVFRKRLLKQRGEWCILIGPLWMHPAPPQPGAALRPSAPAGPSASGPASSSPAEGPASSSRGQAASG